MCWKYLKHRIRKMAKKNGKLIWFGQLKLEYNSVEVFESS